MATFHQEVYDLRPWYHDFERLGLKTRFDDQPVNPGRRVISALKMLVSLKPSQLLGTRLEKRELHALWQVLGKRGPGHLANQPCKEEVLIPYLTRCLDSLQGSPTCLELFCADGYYSCLMAKLCPGAVVSGIDLAATEIERARTAARLLGLDRVEFVIADAWDLLQGHDQYDLVMCAGGLYHLEEPRRFLELLRAITRRYLVAQSVVTLETEDADYFVSPAPGLRHGSRFTHAALERWLIETGWGILDQARNELAGNRLSRDRGSSYFLCEPA